MSEIYQPAEDSYLMQKALKKYIKNKNIKILEIGCGSGIQLMTLDNLGFTNIIGVDINSQAVKHCKSLGLNCVKSDLFSNVVRKYNILIFNPPYLPKDKQEPLSSQTATTGGKKGSEIINQFLKQAKEYLITNGKIILLTSSLTKGINWQDYKKKLLAKKKLFFEELFVWEVSV
jgi:release factor glutamine methyltransferase